MKLKKLQKSQQGFLVIVAIIIVIIFAFVGVIATYLINTDILSSTNHLGGEQALYVAEAGLEGGAHQLSISTIASRTACTGITGNANLTNFTFTGAAGPFTVTGTGPQSPTASTLSGAITASATTIPMTSVATYATTGRIMIDRELMDYVTISGNNFINVVRGVGGTISVAHASGASVGQYQCMLQSQGGVPSLSPAGSVIGGGGRTVKEAVQLPEAWAVADKVGSVEGIIHWNNPTELQWNTASVVGTRNLNGVFALSYADVWTVGDAATFWHWTGNSWTSVNGNSGSTNYFGIHCTASNNCWAVGASKSFDFWNGSSWTLQVATVATLPNVQFNGVYCVASNDCWAVGNTSGGGVIAHWDGLAWTRNVSVPAIPNRNLTSVWCTATNNCWAVGAAATFVQWNGLLWSTITPTVPNVTYNGVTCVNANDCWAVGNNSGGSVIVRRTGGSWSQFSPTPLAVNLLGVSCSKTDSCWAVGASSTTLYWNGSTWTDIANPLGNINLNSVSGVGAATQPASAWQEQFP